MVPTPQQRHGIIAQSSMQRGQCPVGIIAHSSTYACGFYQFKEFLDCWSFALYALSSSSLHAFSSGCRNEVLKNLMDFSKEVLSQLFSESVWKPAALSSPKSCDRVGTAVGSKSSQLLGSIGTQTRPVLGCIQKGAFSKWFMCFDTSMSSLGYVYKKTISSTHLRRPWAWNI